MTAVLLSIHVVAAIVLIGPITVTASVFPRYARAALAEPREAAAPGVLRALHRISAGYSVPAVAVPVFGVATATSLGVLGDTWLIISMLLTVVAAVVLVGAVLPRQRRVLTGLDPRHLDTDGVARMLPSLAASSGVFALIWVVVVILMIVRPGSTTGV